MAEWSVRGNATHTKALDLGGASRVRSKSPVRESGGSNPPQVTKALDFYTPHPFAFCHLLQRSLLRGVTASVRQQPSEASSHWEAARCLSYVITPWKSMGLFRFPRSNRLLLQRSPLRGFTASVRQQPTEASSHGEAARCLSYVGTPCKSIALFRNREIVPHRPQFSGA